MSIRYAKRIDGMNSSAVRDALKWTSKPGVISFAGGMPAPETFPLEKLAAAAEVVYRQQGQTAFQYGTTEGYLPLREKIAARHRKDGMDCTAEQIRITSGSQQGLDLTGKIFLDPGDIVVCETPSYSGAITAFNAYECEYLSIDTDEDGMIMEDLEEKLNQYGDKIKFIYVIPNFQNPSGRTWSLERRKALLQTAVKYHIPIVEDDPYGELRYEDERIPTIKSMDTTGIVIYLGTLSKVLSPGIRVGWVFASPEILEQYNKAKQGADLQTSTVAQMVANVFWEQNDLDAHILELREVYRKRRDLMLQCIEQEFPSRCQYTKPKGGLFIWVTLPEGFDTKEILPRVAENQVAYVPGDTFYPGGDVKNTLRLNFSNADEEHIIKGMQLMGAILREIVAE